MAIILKTVFLACVSIIMLIATKILGFDMRKDAELKDIALFILLIVWLFGGTIWYIVLYSPLIHIIQ